MGRSGAIWYDLPIRRVRLRSLIRQHKRQKHTIPKHQIPSNESGSPNTAHFHSAQTLLTRRARYLNALRPEPPPFVIQCMMLMSVHGVSDRELGAIAICPYDSKLY